MGDRYIVISIRTSTREVTRPIHKNISMSLYFNPHFHKGSDICQDSNPYYLTYFNPHFHKGSDMYSPSNSAIPNRFQSALPQGK